ncbi:hypothetical protein F52700_5828 [Fusarium sp. NRRL 52700]|nr:hypothetical protein F52700_5828 [Fusarium sp. NRRL 52700]
MEFDFFNQRLIIGDTQIVNKPCPRLLTLDETSDLIEKKFGSAVSIGMIPDVILVNPELGQQGRLPRQKCDLCYTLPSVRISQRCMERKALKTVRGLGVFQCPFSAALGRYCTFTDKVEDREDVGDLVYLQRDFYPVQRTMSPPNLFQYLEMEEVSAEEAIENEDGQDDD